MSESNVMQEFFSEGDGSGPMVSTQPNTNTPKSDFRLTTTIEPVFDLSPIQNIDWSPLKSPNSMRPKLYNLLKATIEKKPKSAKKLFLVDKFSKQSNDSNKAEHDLHLKQNEASSLTDVNKNVKSTFQLLKEKAIKNANAPKDLSQYKGSVICFSTDQDDPSFNQLFNKYAQFKLHSNETNMKPGTKLDKLKKSLKSVMLIKRKERHLKEEEDYKIYEQENWKDEVSELEEEFEREKILGDCDENIDEEESENEDKEDENQDVKDDIQDEEGDNQNMKDNNQKGNQSFEKISEHAKVEFKSKMKHENEIEKVSQTDNNSVNINNGMSSNFGSDNEFDYDTAYPDEDSNLESDEDKDKEDSVKELENEFINSDNEESDEDMLIQIKKRKKGTVNFQFIDEEAEVSQDYQDDNDEKEEEEEEEEEDAGVGSSDEEQNNEVQPRFLEENDKLSNENTLSSEFEEETNDKKNKYKCEFIEEEAELSGSEVSSDEEENEDEEEAPSEMLNDENIASNDELRNEIGKVFQKQILDEDRRLLLEFQERYLEDGDLYTDGRKRQRRFKWKNADNVWLHDARNSDSSEVDEDDNDSQEAESEQLSFKLKNNAIISKFEVSFNLTLKLQKTN